MFSNKSRKREPKPNDGNFLLEKGKSLYPLPRHQRVDVTFDDLVYEVQTSRRKNEYKTLLKGISGQLNSSQLTGILGASGAGKSTLMNVLAGYKIRRVSGTIKVNGQNRDLRVFRKLSCYIMENDELIPRLTVMESMMVAANLKLSESISCDQKSKTVDEILEKLGLTECKETRVHQLSKGQRKRLSIAQELVNNPPLMFFDEPTSGLDSQSCYHCIRLLKSLATDGRTIVCTIHQPSAKLFEMFDRLFVLADGSCIYKGSVHALLPYLKSQSLICPPYHNPADYVIEVACGEYGNVVEQLAQCVRSGLCENVEKLCVFDKSKALSSSMESGHSLQQGRENRNQNESVESIELDIDHKAVPQAALDGDRRSMSTMCNTPSCSNSQEVAVDDAEFTITIQPISPEEHLCQLRLLAHIIVGVLIGVLYFGIGNEATKAANNTASLFFSILFIMFTAMMPTVVTFPLEMSIFTREHLNCWYSLKSYYFAKIMADVPFQVLFPIAYSTIVYWMTDQPHDAVRFLLYLLLSILISLTSQSLGLLIGAATSLQVAVFVGPATAIPILLFCGFFVSFDTIPSYLQWLSYLSYVRYAYEGMVLSIYGFNRPAMVCEKFNSTLCIMADPKLVLEALDVDEGNFWLDLMMLVSFFFVFRIGCYFVLRWRIWSQK